ncbi:hypothetical protein EZY14_001870 [Kordia sp. TARA_039_SRF]|nr:hypothetical protein EZY14_001870 [Kordia sp. TARA_039_SRF]
MNKYDIIYQEMNESVFDGAHKLENVHFRMSSNLHSNTYYYVERFLQNKSNCKLLSDIFIERLIENNHDDDITFVGYLNYTGLSLNYITHQLNNTNYGIIEYGEEGFSWQFIPKPKKKIIIVLPVSCTFATYFKLKNWISARFNNEVDISNSFYNLFTILDERLKVIEGSSLDLNNLKKKYLDILSLYKNYNWTKITPNGVVLGDSNNPDSNNISNILIRLYSRLQIAESCEYCYPTSDWKNNARPLVISHPYLDSPNQIFSLPFFDINVEDDSLNIFKENRFLNISQVYGNLSARKSRYLNYIRGNEFYNNNDDQIIDYFKSKISKNINRIVFITSDEGKSSNFLEDFSLNEKFKDVDIEILRLNPSIESIETFMNLNKSRIFLRSSYIIYYDDVIAGAKTFKLLSDYIKHYRETNRKYAVTDRHGFDSVWTLIDRTNYFIKSEIIKKLKSKINEDPEKNFIVFKNLNVPILSSFHLENPLEKRLRDLRKILSQCHLDYVYVRIVREIRKNQFILLPEINEDFRHDEQIEYFPFTNIERDFNNKIIEIYAPYFFKANHNLLKLYLTDKVNSHLSDLFPKNATTTFKEETWLTDLISIIQNESKNIAERFFISPKYVNSTIRNYEAEKRIISYTLIKVLSRFPFQYYKEIKDKLFHYSLEKLEEIHFEIPNNPIRSFEDFRKLKFYVKRNAELGSNFILSKTFFLSIKQYYDFNGESKLLNFYSKTLENIEKSFLKDIITKEYCNRSISNIRYKSRQLLSYFDFLISSYKELIFQEPSRSLFLENVINSTEVLPNNISLNNLGKDEDLVNLIKDPYFHFTGAVKAENLHFIHDLISLHLKNIVSKNFHKKQKSYLKSYYFIGKSQKDPGIINIRKLISYSRFYSLENKSDEASKLDELRNSYAQMLIVLNRLKFNKIDYNSKDDFINKLNGLLNDITKIISNNNDVQLGLFYDYGNLREEPEDRTQIFYCNSTSDKFWLESADLHKKGFVLKFMKGLYNRSSQGKLQSFLAGAKINGNWEVFEDTYFDNDDNKYKIDELLKNDMLKENNESHPYSLNYSTMFMAIKLSELLDDEDIFSKNNNYGKALLIFTIQKESTLDNFLDFFSNEKFRLILAIKKYLLEYLNKQFNNTAFIEVLQKKSKLTYQKVLRHQLGTYYNNLDLLFNDRDSKNKLEFDITLNAIRSQVAAYDINFVKGESHKSKEDIDSLIRTVIESKCLGKQAFMFYKIKNNINDKIKIPNVIYNVIIPQLLINIKQYTENTINQIEILIELNVRNLKFLFKNKIAHYKVINAKNNSKKEGRIMCQKIIDNYNQYVIDSNKKESVKKIVFSYPTQDIEDLEYYETILKIIFND